MTAGLLPLASATLLVATACAQPLGIGTFEALSPDTDQFRLEWNSIPEKVYRIESSTNLLGTWQAVVTNIPATPPKNAHIMTRSHWLFEAFRVAVEPRRGVFINELVASSSDRGVEDPDEPGEYPDWIELYNSSTQPIDISGWYMTDDLGRPAGTTPKRVTFSTLQRSKSLFPSP